MLMAETYAARYTLKHHAVLIALVGGRVVCGLCNCRLKPIDRRGFMLIPRKGPYESFDAIIHTSCHKCRRTLTITSKHFRTKLIMRKEENV